MFRNYDDSNMKKLICISFSFVFCSALFAVTHPFALTCEYIENPLGIDIQNPVLGWKLQSDERSQYQTAFEIMVATSENDLKQEKSLVWKSGKKISSQNNNVGYAGKKLQSFTRYYWKVRVYDRYGKPSEWSDT